MAQSVHIISKAGIRRIVELENASAMCCIRPCPETMLTSGSASMMLSLAGAVCGLAVIASVASGHSSQTAAEAMLSLTRALRGTTVDDGVGFSSQDMEQ